jgi:hypothetical protein
LKRAYGEVRKVVKEIIEIRTYSIFESEAVERNIKVIGDWHSAKLYSLISKKFYLDDWKTEIKEKLNTLEDIYTMAIPRLGIPRLPPGVVSAYSRLARSVA